MQIQTDLTSPGMDSNVKHCSTSNQGHRADSNYHFIKNIWASYPFSTHPLLPCLLFQPYDYSLNDFHD